MKSPTVIMVSVLAVVLLILGGQAFAVAAVAAFLLAKSRAHPFIALYVMVLAMIGGVSVYHDATAWLATPGGMTLQFYRDGMPVAQVRGWLHSLTLWLAFVPAGVFGGAAAYAVSCVRRETVVKEIHQNRGKADGLPSPEPQESAAQAAGSLIGQDRYGRSVFLSDAQANQHTLVLGTTGAGKTVTVCNIVESAIRRGLPLIYIDGKGDYELAGRVARCGQEHDRPVSLFAMNGDSTVYNPLASGGFTSKKDRIIELREWTEAHYKKLAEGYLQSVFKVMEACNIPCNMVTLAAHLDLKKLKALVREHERDIPDAQDLMDELNHQDQAADSISSLVAEIRNFTASEIGPLFKVQEEEPVLTLADVLKHNGVAYFCLPALEFPSMAQTLGRLIINDLKATMAQQLSHGSKKQVYVVFDEFSVFAGTQVLNVINMGRSAGIHAVLSTQSMSDIAVSKDRGDHLVNQIVGSCNNFILHRQNSPSDAAKLAELIGTRNTLEYTAQVSETGPTQMGTVRRTRGFLAHPDEIKALKTGEAYFFTKENNKVRKLNIRRSSI